MYLLQSRDFGLKDSFDCEGKTVWYNLAQIIYGHIK